MVCSRLEVRRVVVGAGSRALQQVQLCILKRCNKLLWVTLWCANLLGNLNSQPGRSHCYLEGEEQGKWPAAACERCSQTVHCRQPRSRQVLQWGLWYLDAIPSSQFACEPLAPACSLSIGCFATNIQQDFQTLQCLNITFCCRRVCPTTTADGLPVSWLAQPGFPTPSPP